MASRTTELKYLRRVLSANSSRFLEITQMEFFHDRSFYIYTEESIFCAAIDVSGAFKGEHWKSLCCALNIYYKKFPGYDDPPLHESGNPIPTRQTRLSFLQERQLDQSSIIQQSGNTSLKYDRNFWNVLDDESNLDEVIEDIAKVVRDVGLPRVRKPQYSRAVMIEKSK